MYLAMKMMIMMMLELYIVCSCCHCQSCIMLRQLKLNLFVIIRGDPIGIYEQQPIYIYMCMCAYSSCTICVYKANRVKDTIFLSMGKACVVVFLMFVTSTHTHAQAALLFAVFVCRYTR